MKYIIARSFLFAKEGEEVKIILGHCLADNLIRSKGEHLEIVCSDKDKIQKYLDGGWIKEVKSLEIWVNEYTDGFGFIRLDKETALRGKNESKYIRTIHFKEVEDNTKEIK
jgi:hypothetical protein